MKRTLSIILVNLLGIASYCHAFEVSTHIKLNEAATNTSTLDGYLKSNLGFSDGVGREIGNQKVIDWIKDGGEFEDQGNLLHTSGRYYNHFHNPFKPWPQVGLSITFQGVTFLNESSLLWAQEPAGYQRLYGNYSWHDGREFFYKGLTSTDTDDRDQAFSETFRAVGQVMHLVEDASVPAHTRNDAHLIYNYEWWVQANEDFLNTTPIFPTVPLSVSIGTYVPITQFWDTNQYDGTMPLTGINIGIAEYSNANFVSDDTIFTEQLDPADRHYFPFPSRTHTVLWVDTIDQTDPATGEVKQVNREYLRKIGEGETVNHFVAVSWLDYWYRLRFFPDHILPTPVGLDENCYYDQAQFLVPRAVGYSAALLNYFFRGQLRYVQGSATFNDKRDEISLKVLNSTAEDEAGYGTLVLLAEFRPSSEEEPVRILSDHETVYSLPRFESDAHGTHSFHFMTPIPDDAQDLTLTVVFRGQLGAEEDGIAVQVFDMEEKNYVFIIQDQVYLNGAPVEELVPYDNRYDEEFHPCDDCEFYHFAYSGSILNWDQTQQVLAGRFVTYGEIEEVEVATTNPCEGRSDCRFSGSKPTLYINDRLVPGGKWRHADYGNANPPETWRIENLPRYSYVYDSTVYAFDGDVTIKVTLKDESVFIQGLAFYDLVLQSGTKYLFSLGSFVGSLGFTSTGSSALLRFYTGFLETPDLSLEGSDLYDIVQINGFGPTKQGDEYVPVISQDEQGRTDRLFVGYWIGWGQGEYSQYSSFICYDAACPKGDPLSQYYDTPTPAPPPFTIQGTFRRRYSEQEQNVLSQKKIQPEYYDLILN